MLRNVCEQRIVTVFENSPAARAGVMAGEWLCFINGERVLDLVDYTYLSYGAELLLSLRSAGGELRSVRAAKGEGEALGLSFETDLMDKMQTCKNHCMFCFVDQMPRNVRDSLRVKDDDWRLSFVMGNYVTLTNVDEEEFSRILKRKVSPIYVSVHATEAELRQKIMRNPSAGSIMGRLNRLKEAGIRFHAQIVLCPGVNDGKHLQRSLADLVSLYPACASVAIVPVGLTRFRENCAELRPFTKREACANIRALRPFARHNLKVLGSRFAFLSDEWYLAAGMRLPSYAACEDFPQIENGVGLLRLFEQEFTDAMQNYPVPADTRTFSVAGGQLASRFFKPHLRRLHRWRRNIIRYPLENRYFGGNVHVAGLLTGGDLLEQLRGKPLGEALLIPGNMLRAGEAVFLDGMTLCELSQALDIPIHPFHTGEELAKLLFD